MSTNSRGDAAAAQALIPGAYERRPATARQSGSMGGPAYGALDPPPSGPPTMDEATIAEHRKEGGGS